MTSWAGAATKGKLSRRRPVRRSEGRRGTAADASSYAHVDTRARGSTSRWRPVSCATRSTACILRPVARLALGRPKKDSDVLERTLGRPGLTVIMQPPVLKRTLRPIVHRIHAS
jgi:hypothetical protein